MSEIAELRQKIFDERLRFSDWLRYDPVEHQYLREHVQISEGFEDLERTFATCGAEIELTSEWEIVLKRIPRYTRQTLYYRMILSCLGNETPFGYQYMIDNMQRIMSNKGPATSLEIDGRNMALIWQHEPSTVYRAVLRFCVSPHMGEKPEIKIPRMREIGRIAVLHWLCSHFPKTVTKIVGSECITGF
ncbi:MAG: hypothetical protein AAGM67_08370 [Bacteroidota bacterium]